ncbi:sugar fermentation stimulation protein [Helicobacter pylori]|nr:sugar fermentation stimulation protein [Helicobacter pylori]RKU97440.1 sugar fermentation stimulation protein [Helicobacter pylori]RKU99827.1 sugar fermentation stimulation protein [Helicobacter pylori]RVZ99495.1 sugar fermentation stimulation protein [Helicobacter pylori]
MNVQKSLSKNRLLNVTNKLKFIKIIIMIKDFNRYCRKITRGFAKTLIKNKKNKEQKR